MIRYKNLPYLINTPLNNFYVVTFNNKFLNKLVHFIKFLFYNYVQLNTQIIYIYYIYTLPLSLIK